MRFSSILAVAAAISPVFSAAVPAQDAALDSPVEERSYNWNKGGKIIAKSVALVQSKVDILSAGVANITTGDINAFLPLLDPSDDLNQTLYAQTDVVKKLKPICEREADYVQTYVVKLIHSVQVLAGNLIKKHDLAVQAAVDGVISFITTSELAASDLFADALISKVPASRKKLAQQDKAKVDKALNKVLAVYGPVPT